jgi:ArsR family transcriptional regulator, zinc-responsive transcriptional repressor
VTVPAAASRADSLTGAVGLLKALASPVRLLVVVELGGGPRCVHELLEAVRSGGREVSQPLMSQHLKVMRESGLVTTTRRGQGIVYELADSHVSRIALDAINHASETADESDQGLGPA